MFIGVDLFGKASNQFGNDFSCVIFLHQSLSKFTSVVKFKGILVEWEEDREN
jgi:hypothetical protein